MCAFRLLSLQSSTYMEPPILPSVTHFCHSICSADPYTPLYSPNQNWYSQVNVQLLLLPVEPDGLRDDDTGCWVWYSTAPLWRVQDGLRDLVQTKLQTRDCSKHDISHYRNINIRRLQTNRSTNLNACTFLWTESSQSDHARKGTGSLKSPKVPKTKHQRIGVKSCSVSTSPV